MNPQLAKIASLKFNQAVIFGAIITAFFYYSMYDDGSQLDAKAASLRQQVEAEKVKERESDTALDRIKQLKESYALLTDQFKIASSQIPVEIQMSDIIRTVDLMAKTSNVLIKTKEPKQTLKEDIIEVFPIKVIAEGGYSDLTKFFYNLSTIERIFKIRSFSIQAPTDPKKSQKLTLEVELASYRFIGSNDKKGPGAN